MGYRSDVAIATTKEGYESLCEHTAKVAKDKGILDLMHNVDEVSEHHDDVIVKFYDIKWYENWFDDVKAVMEWIHEAEHPYEFVRLGEEWDDIEFLLNGSERLEYHISPGTHIDEWF